MTPEVTSNDPSASEAHNSDCYWPLKADRDWCRWVLNLGWSRAHSHPLPTLCLSAETSKHELSRNLLTTDAH